MAIFGPKPWVNPFGKMSVSRLFELLLFISQKDVFFVLEYRKRHFPRLFCLKKRLGKWPFLHESHMLTPLEKCQFFDFLNFLFLYLRKAFFRSRISLKTISWPILCKKKFRKMAIFGPKQWVKPLKKCQFSAF